MKANSRSILILSLLCGYILLQFIWWEILLVKQNGLIIEEKQKLVALSSTDETQLHKDLDFLQHRKKMQTVMIVSEGTVFLLLLLFGIYKVKQSMDKEAALNHQQKNFFLSITHELKTPIAATRLQLQTLQKQKLDEVLQKELLAQALQENDRLNSLIDNVLLSSRMDTNEFSFSRSITDLSAFINQVVTRYYKNELTSGELKTSIEPNIQFAIDESAFTSIITNLIDNAIKYSPVKKEITLSLKREKNGVYFSVKDQGIGISATDKQKVFTKFFRAGSEETRRTKGTGLGLYIVNYMVRNHQGTISVKDNTPKGSNFEIQFYDG